MGQSECIESGKNLLKKFFLVSLEIFAETLAKQSIPDFGTHPLPSLCFC